MASQQAAILNQKLGVNLSNFNKVKKKKKQHTILPPNHSAKWTSALELKQSFSTRLVWTGHKCLIAGNQNSHYTGGEHFWDDSLEVLGPENLSLDKPAVFVIYFPLSLIWNFKQTQSLWASTKMTPLINHLTIMYLGETVDSFE